MLSEKSNKIYGYMKNKYIEEGHSYSGCIGGYELDTILENNRYREQLEAAQELIDKGILQIRNCDEFALELTLSERKKLILENALYDKWQKEAPYMYPNSQYGEITKVLRQAVECV